MPRSVWTATVPHRHAFVSGTVLLLATNALFLGIPVQLGEMIRGISALDPDATRHACLWMSAFAVATAVTRIYSRLWIFNAARAAEYDLRNQLFGHLLVQEPAYVRGHTAEAMTSLTSDIQTVRALWGAGVLNVANTTFAFSTALFMMLRIDPWLTALAIVPYPMIVLVGRVYGKRIFRASQQTQRQLAHLSAGLQEDFGGIAVIRSYNAEPYRRQAVEQRSSELLSANMALVRTRGQLAPLLAALGSLGTLAVLWLGGARVFSGDLDVPHLVEFSGYLARLIWPTLALGWMLSLWQRGHASWQRIAAQLDRQPRLVTRVTRGSAAAAPSDDVAGTHARDTTHPVVAVRHLTIHHDDRRTLDDITLQVMPGEHVAIVGATGSGKSTLCDAVAGLIEVPKGTVEVLGCDLATEGVPQGDIGYAQQDAFLFSTTIGDNIAFGIRAGSALAGLAPDELERSDVATASLAISALASAPRAAQLQEAARAAGLSSDLDGMRDGLATIVGERGITLSGGQRQRVALARALIGRPRLLILDDSLSSVDAETEAAILRALDEWIVGLTTIFVSHRIEALRRADRIYVLEEGRIVECGTHDELVQANGCYTRLYRTQLAGAAG